MQDYSTFELPKIPEAVRASYADLRRDQYLDFKERYRRYANFKVRVFDDNTKVKVTRMQHKPYYQGKQYHETLGGMDRAFEPILADVTGLIAQCSVKVPIRREEDYLLRVHQFRTVVRRDEPGLCAPEGPHRDGVDYAVMVSIDRSNITGGASQILASKTSDPMYEVELKPHQVLVVRDTNVYHNVTDIELMSGAAEGHRDVLLWGFIPWEQSRYKELYGDAIEQEKIIDVGELMGELI